MAKSPKKKASRMGGGMSKIQEIRAVEHRTVGSRQSKKPAERSNQRRQPKTGGSGGHGRTGRADRTSAG